MDPQNDSLNKKSENTIQNCQNLASSKQSYDNLEKIMREQLESLKNSANILRANGQQSNQNNEAIILNSRSNKIQIRQKSNIRTKIEQNQNQMIQIDEESQKKRANYQPPRKEISSNKINSINNDNSNCSNIFQVIKNDKENIRISAASQNREFAVQSKIEERLEEHYASQPSSLVQSPRRKKNNFVVGNYFVESRLNIDNTNKPYLFKRLKQQLENSKGFSFYQDTTEKKGNSSQSSTIQSNNCNNNSIIWNNNSQINGNTIRIRSKNQKDYFDINNIHTSISNNKSTLKSNRKEDMNNSLFSTLADSQLHQQYTRKRNSLYQNSHQNQQISNRITGDLYRDRDGSGLSNHNFYSIKNSVSQNSSQRRDSSSLTQRYLDIQKL